MNIKKKMKVTASKRIQAAVTDSYDFTDRVKFGKNRYRIMYTGVNTEASAESMFNDFRFQISVSNPYDDADYAWCYGDRGVIKIIKEQKVIHKAFYFNADDMDVENTEWCDEVVHIALSELEKINGRIEQRIIHNSRKITADSAVEDDEDDIKTVDQEYDSANTSINSTKLPAIYNMVNFPRGAVVLDYGGGKFDNAIAYLDSIGCKGYVYDPYNRSAEHNREVIKTIRANGGADITLCSNVLNVIKEPEARQNVLENIKKLTKPSGKVYITVYEGKGDGAEGPTKAGYQLNRKTAGYLDEVKEVFPEASRKGKLICASYRVSPKHIKSSRNATFRNDKRISPTSERYKGYLIVLDRGGDGYNVYDKHRELEDAGYPSIDAAKKFIDELVANDDVYSAHSAEKVDWYELDWDEQIQLMNKYVRQYKGSRIFEDFAEYIDEPVEDIIDAFSDAEYRGDLRIPERMQLDSEYRNDDIYSTSQIIRSVDGTLNKLGGPATFRRELMATIEAYPGIEDDIEELADMMYGSYKGVISIEELESAIEYMIDDALESTEAVNSSYSPNLLNDLVNYYRPFDTMSSEEIWDEILAEYNNEDLANDVLESLDHEEDLDLADEEDEYVIDGFEKIQSSSSVEARSYGGASSNRYWYFTRHGVQPGSVPNYVNILDIVDKPEGSYFLADGVILTNDLRDYDIKERKPEDSVTSSTRIKSKGNDQYTDVDLQDIAEKIEAVVVAVIMQDEGFDESEAKMYSRVTISDIDDNELYIEVGAEVSYESLERICSECDKVIQALPGVDENSYFEPIESGLAGCYVYSK